MDRSTTTSPANRTLRQRLVAVAGIAGVALALLAPSAASAATPTTGIATAAEDAGCPGHWPAAVQGVPVTYHAGAKAGDYLWHDSAGWHLRVTKITDARAVFTGRIVADAAMTVRGRFLDSQDAFTLSADRKTLTYRFVNHGHLDGLDIRTTCATRLEITGTLDGTRLPASRVWIGAAGAHPLGVPFAILRVP